MIACTSCGASAPDQSRTCGRCGAVLTNPANDETIAIPFGPPSTASPSRASSVIAPDEGRFLSGTLVAGRYRIIGLLGRGGMGEVYRATDLTLAQSVALKFLPEDAATNERLLERFHNEVRVARQVSHPNVCRVYDIGEADGLPFISMEYVDGEDLGSLLQRIGRLPSDKALEIARKLCAGLAAAHERGIIHRDLKPQNVMLNKRGEVVIMDFGLAAVAEQLRGAEARNGTPAYMAPEQLAGNSVTARSDIYALGLIVYELFTGKRAFEAATVADLMKLQESGRPLSITSIASDVDPAVEKAILRCLQADPLLRPATALAVAAALPGGDPLAAALAAGETPSPELVAASGHTAGFALRYAAPCLAFVLLGLLAIPWLMQPISMLAITPMEFPPAVLEQKARETAAAFGYPARPADWISWFVANTEMVTHLEKQTPGAKDWKQLLSAESPVTFVYRQSPRYLTSPPDGGLASERPPMSAPGMVMVRLDSRARLRQFQAVAPRYDEPGAAPANFDPALVLQHAGLDAAQLREAAPAYAPPLAFDARRAWIGSYPGLPGVEITVEMATWRGKLTSFMIRWPWTQPPPTSEEPSKARDLAYGLFTLLFLGTALFCAIFFARRNLRLGRGDRQGAFRLATAAAVLFLVDEVAGLHVMPRFEMIGYAFVDLSVGLMRCGLLWLAYVALEPAVRARWPHSLITWNRLLAGQYGDPRLGSHILIGVVIGVAMRYLFLWRWHWLMARGGPPSPIDLNVLLGLRPLVENLGNTILNAITAGVVIFFILCGLRALLRYDWLAALAAAVLLTFQEGGIRNSANLAIDLPIYIGVYAAFGFALLRMGLVPTILGIIVVNTLSRIPVGAEFSAWYNPVAAAQITLIAAIAIYGFWRSQSSASPA